MGKEQLLQPRLDVDAEPPLERDHALGVPRGPQPTGLTSLAPAREQVERVDAEADRTSRLPENRRSCPVAVPGQRAYLPLVRNWRRNLVRSASAPPRRRRSLWLFLREVDVGEAWREITALPGWTMVVALGLVVANVVIMSVPWGYPPGRGGLPDRPLEALLHGRGRTRREQHPARRGGDLLRIEAMRERRVRCS